MSKEPQYWNMRFCSCSFTADMFFLFIDLGICSVMKFLAYYLQLRLAYTCIFSLYIGQRTRFACQHCRYSKLKIPWPGRPDPLLSLTIWGSELEMFIWTRRSSSWDFVLDFKHFKLANCKCWPTMVITRSSQLFSKSSNLESWWLEKHIGQFQPIKPFVSSLGMFLHLQVGPF